MNLSQLGSAGHKLPTPQGLCITSWKEGLLAPGTQHTPPVPQSAIHV